MTVNRLYSLHMARFSSQKRWQRMSKAENTPGSKRPPDTLLILTWNVDFQTPKPRSRLLAALGYIQRDVLRCKDGEAPKPCCLLLQEVNVRAFRVILDNEWVKEHFRITPHSPDKWPDGSTYGNVTLVSRTVPVSQAGSLVFASSKLSRNALLVDLKLSVPESSRSITLRVGNTHLESMPEGAGHRPKQMKLVADQLAEEGLDGGIVCGDMNAIGPSDAEITRNVGLVDAWEGGDDEKSGHTWGYQPISEFPPGRLDKILFTPDGSFEVEEPRKVGVGVKTVDELWISDHYGLLTTVRVVPR